MEESSFRLDGAVVYWTAAECNEAYLRHVRGADPLIPARRQPPTILREALESVAKDKAHLVRPTADRRTFAVVRETRDRSGNEYRTTALATVDKNETVDVGGQDWDAPDVDTVRAAYHRRAAVLTCAQVTAFLCAHVGRLNGTRLREAGGVYWLPDGAVGAWRGVTSDVASAAADRPPLFYLIRHRFDADGLRAVRDAITAEIEAAADEIRRDAQDTALGVKAQESRRDRARELADKVRTYESILGESLAGLTAAANEAELAAATAAIAAAATAAREADHAQACA